MSEEYDVSDQEYMSDDYGGEDFRAGIDAFGRVGQEQNEEFAPVWGQWSALQDKLGLGEFSSIEKDLKNVPNVKRKIQQL